MFKTRSIKYSDPVMVDGMWEAYATVNGELQPLWNIVDSDRFECQLRMKKAINLYLKRKNG